MMDEENEENEDELEDVEATAEDEEEAALVPIKEMLKLDKDLFAAIRTMGPRAARMLVYFYYMLQEDRKRSGSQLRKLTEANEPCEAVSWFFSGFKTYERQSKLALQTWAESQRIARWTMSLFGMGPVISAGLAAHIDIKKATTVGHIYRFAGLVPGQRWWPKAEREAMIAESFKRAKKADDPNEEAIRLIAAAIGRKPENLLLDAQRLSYKKGETAKRDEHGRIILTKGGVTSAGNLCTWNQDLKTLCWKIGDCFWKFSKKEKCFYGKLARQQWAKEHARNEAGEFASQAAAILEGKSGKKPPGKGTAAYKAYIVGKFPKGHLFARARRWTVKVFLSHYHFKARTYAGLPAPRPYALDHLGHVDYIEPPADVD